MNELSRQNRNEQRLTELYPTFREKVQRIIKDLENIGFRPRIQSAWRSPEDQIKAFEEGHAEVLYSFHNVVGLSGKPEALAVDLLDDDYPLNPRRAYLLHLAAAAQNHGLQTGIRWGLPEAMRIAIDDAIASENWTATLKVGWDPTHVQPVGIKISDTKPPKNMRPE